MFRHGLNDLMAEIYFYHLENTPMEPLLLRMVRLGFDRGIRMAVETTQLANLPKLSEMLWAAEDVAFMPHGHSDDAPEHQPLWLCADAQNPNNAVYRFYIEGAMPDQIDGLDRALILFDSNSEEVLASARNEWKKRKAEGHAISYWKMDENGKWQNLA